MNAVFSPVLGWLVHMSHIKQNSVTVRVLGRTCYEQLLPNWEPQFFVMLLTTLLCIVHSAWNNEAYGVSIAGWTWYMTWCMTGKQAFGLCNDPCCMLQLGNQVATQLIEDHSHICTSKVLPDFKGCLPLLYFLTQAYSTSVSAIMQIRSTWNYIRHWASDKNSRAHHSLQLCSKLQDK